MLSVTKTAGRRLEHLCKSFTKVSDAVGKLTETDDVCLILLHDEQLSKFINMILEAPSLKNGEGKELRKLHDTVQHHI